MLGQIKMSPSPPTPKCRSAIFTASAAGIVLPRRYLTQVGDEGFKKQPIGAGPYRFVRQTPGIEVVLDAFPGYWRRVPSVKTLVMKSVPESTARAVMLKSGEADIAYVLDALRTMDRLGASTVEVRPDALAAYNEDIQAKVAGTVWNTGGCKSWYLDKTGRNTSLWPDFTFVYRRRTRRFDPDHYAITSATGAPIRP